VPIVPVPTASTPADAPTIVWSGRSCPGVLVTAPPSELEVFCGKPRDGAVTPRFPSVPYMIGRDAGGLSAQPMIAAENPTDIAADVTKAASLCVRMNHLALELACSGSVIE
jgi:hypothetical protein